MNNTIKILKHINKEGPGEYQDKAPTGKLEGLFSLRHSVLPITPTNKKFINEMNKHFHNDLGEIIGVERYFFNLDYAVMEVMITFNEDKTLTIEPFIFYEEKEIRDEIQKVMSREFKLYCLLKKWELQ